MKPYKEHRIKDNESIRTFSIENKEEFVWHRDKEDRIIESLDNTDWLIQFDNELPIQITSEIHIPKNKYHRIIPGENNELKLKLKKL